MKEEFLRTAMLVGENGISALNNAHVCVVGLGGVGSYTVEALARAGVGALTLIDGDTVSLSNINRQLYALHSSVGMPKTDVAKNRVLDINPDCRVYTKCDYVTPDNAENFFADNYTFCVDAVDDTNAKTALAVLCKQRNIPLIASMGTGSKADASFIITDISKTEYCPLCRVMRKKYKAAGLESVTVLFSKDAPVENKLSDENISSAEYKKGAPPPSSISFVPSAAGLKIAGYVIHSILNMNGIDL